MFCVMQLASTVSYLNYTSRKHFLLFNQISQFLKFSVRFLICNLEIIFVSIYLRCNIFTSIKINHIKLEYFWKETLFSLMASAAPMPELLRGTNLSHFWFCAICSRSDCQSWADKQRFIFVVVQLHLSKSCSKTNPPIRGCASFKGFSLLHC